MGPGAGAVVNTYLMTFEFSLLSCERVKQSKDQGPLGHTDIISGALASLVQTGLHR